ncbi:DUF1822 family protein [Chlorogloeopsis sp. ULAP01]|uniref:DUF1822 family protein n=1 Tax=Chlorogloeopsis sp. ULAP01 TaxID=3056483 RepID=UPI0025AA32D6|nr:DUF1822 family protein [Chlorogloeopsis sp. ULAP01]MDM9385501.1 DUF1822 family protein [Chlorogloeopsis sp. ULAP01]
MTKFELDNKGLTLPITQAARTIAQHFANQQPTSKSAERVRLNTLCVLVVNDYLQMMNIPTDLKSSNTWNPVIRMCADVADIEIPGIGSLECRPIRLNEQFCYIPPETWEERIGYLVVQVDESQLEAKVLGFVRNVTSQELPLSQLQPLEALIEHLSPTLKSTVPESVSLSQWFAGIFETGWQTLESLWNQPEFAPDFVFRSKNLMEKIPSTQPEQFIRRGKLIDLGIQIASQFVILIVEISPYVDQQVSVRLQLHPTGSQNYLPQDVKLTVLDHSGAVFLEAQARSADNYIQLQFRGEPTEQFSVQVALNDAQVTERFVI